jgi:hypothetical protein
VALLEHETLDQDDAYAAAGIPLAKTDAAADIAIAAQDAVAPLA